MKSARIILLGLLAVSGTAMTAAASEQQSKPGQVYDEAQGTCVTPRGS